MLVNQCELPVLHGDIAESYLGILLRRVDACYQRKITKVITAWLMITAIFGVVVTAIIVRELDGMYSF